MRWLRVARTSSKSGTYYRLRLEVEEALGVDENVFLYLALPLASDEDEQRAEFQGVCSPYDMIDVPVGEPTEDADPQWVRHNVVDLMFRSLTEFNAGLSLLIEQLETLLGTLDSLDLLEPTDYFEIGESESESEA